MLCDGHVSSAATVCEQPTACHIHSAEAARRMHVLVYYATLGSSIHQQWRRRSSGMHKSSIRSVAGQQST